MVTLLQPNRTQSNIQDPEKAQHDTGFIVGIAHPLRALYDLVSGPAMTQRDRHRRELGEETLRNSAGLNWFSRTTW